MNSSSSTMCTGAKGAGRPTASGISMGIDDFALRRGLVYTTVLIDAKTGRRVDVVLGRTTDAAEAWLRDHPGAEVLCRDGSGAYGEAARRTLPSAAASPAALTATAGSRSHGWHR